MISRSIMRFARIQAAGGIVLLAATVAALVWANVSTDTYVRFWHSTIGIDIVGFELREDLVHWVNDALMVFFFFVVGLEIKREWEVGELVDRRAALLPALAAIGGMVVPAGIFVVVNLGSDDVGGWGIPMATDIAFALGVIAVLGHRVPPPLKVFLLTLAIVDDIGAIVVIAAFYSESISYGWLALAFGLIAVTYAMRRAGVWYLPAYVVVGVGVWLAKFESGVHATLAGVILGVITPARAVERTGQRDNAAVALSPDDVELAEDAARLMRDTVPVGARLEREIHPWTSFVIVPIFALANAGIVITGDTLTDAAASTVTLGVVAGLVVGKLVGISGAVMLTRRAGWADLPAGSTMRQVVGVAAVAGIGFTVSLFIAGLAYDDTGVLAQAKVGILCASTIAALLGAGILVRADRRRPLPETADEIRIGTI